MKYLKPSDAKAHSETIRTESQELIDHIRNDIGKIEDTKAKALFETSAEVLTGLETAFSHYPLLLRDCIAFLIFFKILPSFFKPLILNIHSISIFTCPSCCYMTRCNRAGAEVG